MVVVADGETYEVWVHCAVDLQDPVTKIVDLSLKVPRIGRTFKRPKHAQHPCCRPCVAYTHQHRLFFCLGVICRYAPVDQCPGSVAFSPRTMCCHSPPADWSRR